MTYEESNEPANDKLFQLFAFGLDKQRRAPQLSAVERNSEMAEGTPLTKASEFVIDLVNFRRQIIPIVIAFPSSGQQIDPCGNLINLNTSRGTVVPVADSSSRVDETIATEGPLRFRKKRRYC